MDSRSVSLIMIGDEILNGETIDTNSNYLCRELYKHGVKVSRISVIRDNVDVIADEVRAHSNGFSLVLTSGGIGPTHDDITYEGVAKAFHEKLVLNKGIKSALKHLCLNLGLDDVDVHKMSLIPESAKVHYTRGAAQELSIPLVSVHNVFIFPGIPSYLEHIFAHLKHLFLMHASCYYIRNIYVNVNEFCITEILNKAVKEFENKVKVGSYPDVQCDWYQVKITLEAEVDNDATMAEAFLRSHLPVNSVVGRFPPNSKESFALMLETCKVKSKLYDSELAKVIDESFLIIQNCFEKYPIENVCISFNGGKDCTVLLHLTHLVMHKMYPSKCPKMKVSYIHSKDMFPDMEEFIKLCVERYNLNLITSEPPIKSALSKLQKDYPEIQAVLMGSRKTDPYCSDYQTFQMTDEDWPQFMRINPLLNWNYHQVWKFLRTLDVPYCSLYDKGYTSLGCQNDTLPNAELISSTKDGETYYLPAYLLRESHQEREGRTIPKSKC